MNKELIWQDTTKGGRSRRRAKNSDAECTHYKSYTTVKNVKNLLNKNPSYSCTECLDPLSDDKLIWLCLKCGLLYCGSFNNLSTSTKLKTSSHMNKHFETEKKGHCLAICINTYIVWCRLCKDIVSIPDNCNKMKSIVKLIEHSVNNRNSFELSACMQNLSLETVTKTYCKSKKNVTMLSRSDCDLFESIIDQNVSSNPEPSESESIIESSKPDSKMAKKTVTSHSVRGLRNLGNTCFLNAVLQCLAHTPYLRALLLESSGTGEAFTLHGRTAEENNNAEPVLPLEGHLDGWGPLTAALAGVLGELTSTGTDVVVPEDLVSELGKHAAYLTNGQQHDSQELLRCLLEAVKTEDLHRFKSKIEEIMSNKEESTTADELQEALQVYHRELSSELLMRPDQLFKFTIISTLTCQNCDKVSETLEKYLDLSLSITPETTEEIKIIKQMKKVKITKKVIKTKKVQRVIEKQKKKNKEVVEQINDECKDFRQITKGEKPRTKHEKKKDEFYRLIGMTEFFWKCALEANQHPNLTFDELVAPGEKSAVEKLKESIAREEAAAAAAAAAVAVENVESESEKKTENTPLLLSSSSVSEDEIVEVETEVEGEEEVWEERQENVEEVVKHERFSLEICLQHYTGVSQVSGKKCTCKIPPNARLRSGVKHREGLPSPHTRRELLDSAPAIMTLHLKRFEGMGNYPRKVSTHIPFPMELDMTPYCTDKCKDSVLSSEEGKVLYSLYGVVQHSGSLKGGHYEAFVKVSPDLNKRSKFALSNWPPPETSSSQSDTRSDDGNKGTSQGKWFHADDNKIKEVSEDFVLERQAYLLFYARTN